MKRFTLRPLYLGNNPLYTMDRRLCRHQRWSERCGVEKNLFPYREWNPGRPALVRSYTDRGIPVVLKMRTDCNFILYIKYITPL
jgi:hypothetical protein